MKVKTSDLQGAALDWAVAKCEGHYHFDTGSRPWDADASNPDDEENGCVWFKPSTDWAQGGPIIEREHIAISGNNLKSWVATASNLLHPHYCAYPLIAAMRCYVASQLGEEVDIPDEIIHERV